MFNPYFDFHTPLFRPTTQQQILHVVFDSVHPIISQNSALLYDFLKVPNDLFETRASAFRKIAPQSRTNNAAEKYAFKSMRTQEICSSINKELREHSQTIWEIMAKEA